MKKIFSLFIAALCCASMSAKKVWIDVSSVTGYADKMQVHYWNDDESINECVWTQTTTVTNVYYAEIDDEATKWQTCRGEKLDTHWDNWGSVVTYADNNKYTVTGWSNSGTSGNVVPFVIVGNGSDNWIEDSQWTPGNTDNAISTSKTYSECAAGLKIFRIVPYGIWDEAHGYAQVASCNVPFVTNADNNIVFATNKQADITIAFDGTNITITVANSDSSDPKDAILGGDYVMCYFGDKWSDDKKYLYKTSVGDYYDAEHFVKNSDGARIAVGLVEKDFKYYVTHSTDWGGIQMANNVVQGSLYLNNSDGGNNNQHVGASAIPSISNVTFNKGTASSGMSASATPNHSVLGESYPYSYTYFYTRDNGYTWTEFDPTDVSDLAVGTYTVRALANDGHIYIVSNAATMTINATGTAVENVADEAKAIKRVINGQLVIERDGKMYNALGAEVK